MPAHLAPQRIRHGIAPVGQPGQRLGQLQRGALGLVEKGRFAPGGDGEDMFVRHAGLLQFLGVHVDTDAAAIDLAGAQMRQLVGFQRQLVIDGVVQREQCVHGVGQDHHGVVHSGLHDYSPWQLFPDGCHIGRIGTVTGMTKRGSGM
jgi:hypothetical protein